MMRMRTGIVVLSVAALMGGCGGNAVSRDGVDSKMAETASFSQPAAETSAAQMSLEEVMFRISEDYDLNLAERWENPVEDLSEDALVLLCQSEDQKYAAYGFISPEYGKKGILMNNIIDGDGNWNYFEYSWDYGERKPSLKEQGEYGAVFAFTGGDGEEREIYFETFETGTMDPVEER